MKFLLSEAKSYLFMGKKYVCEWQTKKNAYPVTNRFTECESRQ